MLGRRLQVLCGFYLHKIPKNMLQDRFLVVPFAADFLKEILNFFFLKNALSMDGAGVFLIHPGTRSKILLEWTLQLLL
jgi:hypothetical protein